MVLAVALLLLLVGFAACSGGGGDDSADSASESPADELTDGDLGAGDDDSATAGTGGGGTPTTTPATGTVAPALGLDELGRAVAIEATVRVATSDVTATVDAIIAAARAHGGAVFSADIDYAGGDTPDTARATIVVKIPPADLDGLLTRLRDTGDVIAFQQDAQDVTDQLVDLDTRILTAAASVERVRALLIDAVDLDAVIRLEAELTRRETALEQYHAAKRNVADRVALSTLTIDVVHRAAPDPALDLDAAEVDASNGLGDAFRNGWDAFVAVFFTVALVLAVLAPFIALGAVLASALWLIGRVIRVRPPVNAADDAPPDQSPQPASASRRE